MQLIITVKYVAALYIYTVDTVMLNVYYKKFRQKSRKN